MTIFLRTGLASALWGNGSGCIHNVITRYENLYSELFPAQLFLFSTFTLFVHA